MIKRHWIIPPLAFLVIFGSFLIENTLERFLITGILFFVLVIIYYQLKGKELGYYEDERETLYSKEAARIAIMTFNMIAFVLVILGELNIVGKCISMSFAYALLILNLFHLVIYKALLWLK